MCGAGQFAAQSRQPDIICVHQNGIGDSYYWAVDDLKIIPRIEWLHTGAQLPQQPREPLSRLLRHPPHPSTRPPPPAIRTRRTLKAYADPVNPVTPPAPASQASRFMWVLAWPVACGEPAGRS